VGGRRAGQKWQNHAHPLNACRCMLAGGLPRRRGGGRAPRCRLAGETASLPLCASPCPHTNSHAHLPPLDTGMSIMVAHGSHAASCTSLILPKSLLNCLPPQLCRRRRHSWHSTCLLVVNMAGRTWHLPPRSGRGGRHSQHSLLLCHSPDISSICSYNYTSIWALSKHPSAALLCHVPACLCGWRLLYALTPPAGLAASKVLSRQAFNQLLPVCFISAAGIGATVSCGGACRRRAAGIAHLPAGGWRVTHAAAWQRTDSRGWRNSG